MVGRHVGEAACAELQSNRAQICSSLYTEMREEAKSFSERLLNNRLFFFLVPHYEVAFCCRSIELLCLRWCLIFPSYETVGKNGPEKKVFLLLEQAFHIQFTTSTILSCNSEPVLAAVSGVGCLQQITG